MKVKLEIERFNPEKDSMPYTRIYSVEAAGEDRVLDLLMRVQRQIDGTLAFRKSCAHGICGSDAMFINGEERLACKTLVKDAVQKDGERISIKPLRNLPVEKDLMVDQEKFFESYRAVKPFLISAEQGVERERLQSPKERSAFDDPIKCILCEACYSACPVIQEKNPLFIGPAAIVQAARFLLDSRDRGFEDRLPALDEPNGVWPCENHFQCTRVCPRGIKVTKLINMMKRLITRHREGQGGK